MPPALTGWWQVNGKNNTTFSEMIELDLSYGRMMSPWLDVKIIGKTFPAIAKQVWESQVKRSQRKAATGEAQLGARSFQPVEAQAS